MSIWTSPYRCGYCLFGTYSRHLYSVSPISKIAASMIALSLVNFPKEPRVSRMNKNNKASRIFYGWTPSMDNNSNGTNTGSSHALAAPRGRDWGDIPLILLRVDCLTRQKSMGQCWGWETSRLDLILRYLILYIALYHVPLLFMITW